MLQVTASSLPVDTARWLFLGFLVAFAVKAPIVPFHAWQPDAYTEAPTGALLILAGVLPKIATYGLLRFNIGLFPEAATYFRGLIMVLALVGIIYGAVVAIVQTDLKRLIAYSSISHIGFIVLGLFAFTQQGMSGSVLYMVNHALSTGLLFVMVGLLYERMRTRDIGRLGGVAAITPKMAAMFLVAGLASMGLPGLNNFVSEFLVIVGTFGANEVWGSVAAAGVLLSAIYFLWAYQRVDARADVGGPHGEARRGEPDRRRPGLGRARRRRAGPPAAAARPLALGVRGGRAGGRGHPVPGALPEARARPGEPGHLPGHRRGPAPGRADAHRGVHENGHAHVRDGRREPGRRMDDVCPPELVFRWNAVSHGPLDFGPVLPELILVGAGLTLLLVEAIFKRLIHAWLAVGALVGIVAAGWASVWLWDWAPRKFQRDSAVLGGMVAADRFSVVARLVLLAVAAIGIGFGHHYFKRTGEDRGEFYGLLLVCTSGMTLIVAANNLIVVFLALEILSLSLYVLTGFSFRLTATEGAMKYFLLGAFSSAFFLYGIAMAYGAADTTSITGIARNLGGHVGTQPLALAAAGLLAVGFAFKVAAVPFHTWAPDAYQGAPTPITAYMSAATKVAAFAALLRVFNVAFAPLQWDWTPFIGCWPP